MSSVQNTYEHPLRHRLFVGTEIIVSAAAFAIIGIISVGGFFIYNLFSNVTELDIASAPAYTPATSILEPEKTTDNALQKVLDEYATTLPTDAGIVVHNLKTNEHAEINAHKPFVTASMYKLFVSHEALRLIEAGELSFYDPAGNDTGLNVRQCIRDAITVSSNACGQALGRIVGFVEVNPQLKAIGFDETDLTRYDLETTADDIYVYFSHLYNGITLNASNQELLLNELLNQKINDRLSQGLPYGTKFAHKTGSLFNRYHDGGIVYRHGDYIVVMLSGPWSSKAQSNTYFANLATAVDTHFSKN